MSLIRRTGFGRICTKTNPLLSNTPSGFPLWAQITPEVVKPAMERLLSEMESKLLHLEKTVTPTWEGLVEPYERLGDDLERAWGQVSHLKSVKDTEVTSALNSLCLSSLPPGASCRPRRDAAPHCGTLPARLAEPTLI